MDCSSLLAADAANADFCVLARLWKQQHGQQRKFIILCLLLEHVMHVIHGDIILNTFFTLSQWYVPDDENLLISLKQQIMLSLYDGESLSL